jgi:hypothetical protein
MFKINIIDYLGKHENGVIVLINIEYEEIFYEASFYYTDSLIALTVDESLEKKIGCDIEDWENYNRLVSDILNKIVPYEEIINIVNDFDPSKYDIHLSN